MRKNVPKAEYMLQQPFLLTLCSLEKSKTHSPKVHKNMYKSRLAMVMSEGNK